MSGQITRKEIITDEALKWGDEYSKMMQAPIDKNKEFVATLLELYEANKKVRSSSSSDYQNSIKKTNELSESAIIIWKEQIQLENQLISTKRKNELATESTNKALVKERVALAETNKEIKLQARNQLGLITSYEKLNRLRNEAQKTLANLLSAEQKNTKEIARATVEFEKLDARVKAVDAAIKNYSKNIGNYGSAFNGLNNTAKELMSTFGVVTGLALFGTIVKDIFNVVKDFDRQLIAVGKTTNMAKAELKEFGKEVVDLGGKLDGVSIEGLLASSEVAGQLGVTGTANILKFAESIEKLKLTSNIISDEQVGQFAKFIEVSSDSFDNADRLASVITRLGNEFATTEAEVLENSTEIQKGVAVWNTAASSVLGLGAATSTLGSEAEASRSAIQSTFKVIDTAIATGANLEKILKLTGLTQKELSNQFNKDATGVFVKFIGGLSKAKSEGENLNRILTDVDITEKRAFTVIGALAANYGVLEAAMASASNEYQLNAALNKEVAAASESVASILTDIKDKWQEYILTTNQANGGTEMLAKGLKFLRDNLQSIIANIVKYGAVLLTFFGIQKAVNFITLTWTAIQTAATVAQIRFALATGIGTRSILAQAEAARAAMVAQQGLNVAVSATPWGLILAFLSAAVVAYMVFNDEMSRAEKNINDIAKANENLRESEKGYASDRDKYREQNFKAIEDEIKLRKAKGENSEKLDQEEIKRKKETVQAQINVYADLKKVELERTKNEIAGSTQRIAQMQLELKWFDETNYRVNKNGKTKDEVTELIITEKEKLNIKKGSLSENSKLTTEEIARLNKIISDLDKDKAVKDAEFQAEVNKKAIAAARKRAKELYEIEKKRIDDEFKLKQFRLQVRADLEKEYSQEESNMMDDRIESLFLYQKIQNQKTKEAAEYELKQLGKYNEEKMRFERELTDKQVAEIIERGKTNVKLTSAQQLIYEKYQNDLTQATKKGIDDRQKLIDSQVDIVQKEIDYQLQQKDTALQKELQAENDAYLKKLELANGNNKLIQEAVEAHEKALLDIKKKAAIEDLKLQVKSLEDTINSEDGKFYFERISAEKRAEINNQLAKLKTELSDLEKEKYVQNLIDKETAEQMFKDRVTELSIELKDTLVNLTNAIFDAKISKIDEEITANDEYYQKQIELAGDDARKKDLLQAESDKKKEALEKKKKKAEYNAAVFNRIMALADIAIKTAQAIAAANVTIQAMNAISFGTAGTAYGAIAIPAIYAMAGLQAAAVLATPLPKYKDGRKGGKAEFAVVGDGGRQEVITDPFGNNPTVTPSVPTFTYLPEDYVVHKSVDDYKKYMKNSMYNQLEKNSNSAKNYQILVANNNSNFDEKAIEKAIESGFKKAKTNVNVHNKFDLGHEIWKLSNTNWKA